MGKDTVFLYAIAAVAVCFALVNALLLLVKRGKTAQTIGTISSIKMPNAETAKARNSKWAEITYTVDGKTYRSSGNQSTQYTKILIVFLCFALLSPMN